MRSSDLKNWTHEEKVLTLGYEEWECGQRQGGILLMGDAFVKKRLTACWFLVILKPTNIL